MPLLGRDNVVPRAYKPLLSVGCRRNSVNRITRSSAEGDHLGSEHDMALRWIEENVTKYRESKAPTAESIHAIDYNRRLELFETVCKVFAIPMEVRHVGVASGSFRGFERR